MQTPEQQVDAIHEIIHNMLDMFRSNPTFQTITPFLSLMRQWHDYITIIRGTDADTPLLAPQEDGEITFLKQQIAAGIQEIEQYGAPQIDDDL